MAQPLLYLDPDSAAQVRKPIYSSSVARWKCYDRQLAPLAGKLKEHGFEVD